MSEPCELKNWKLEVNKDQLHAIGQSRGMRIKTSPVVRIDGEIVETAIGAKFRLNPKEKSMNHWDVAFRITQPFHTARVIHLLQ